MLGLLLYPLDRFGSRDDVSRLASILIGGASISHEQILQAPHGFVNPTP